MCEVLGESSVPCKPCEGALDDPAFGQDDKLGTSCPASVGIGVFLDMSE